MAVVVNLVREIAVGMKRLGPKISDDGFAAGDLLALYSVISSFRWWRHQ